MTDHPPLRASVPPARMRTPANTVRVHIDDGRLVLTFVGGVHTEVWVEYEVANQMVDDVANELRKIGWSVAPPLTPEACKHPKMTGFFSMGTGGSRASGRCPDCGYSYDSLVAPVVPRPAGRETDQ